MRPGARPWECPTCNPGAAKRREVERERAARRQLAEINERDSKVDVPDFLQPVIRDMVELISEFPTPGREELAAQIRSVARARGHLELKAELKRMGALCASWAAWLPDTVNVPNQERDAA